jgi:hypothetical protein
MPGASCTSLHTFTGVRTTDPTDERDWMLTNVWAFTTDAVAAGLIVIVFSSYMMWYRFKAKHRGGVVVLVLGLATCGAFVAGLRCLNLRMLSRAHHQRYR